ncbi:MAG: hypothetical protein HY909_14105 [Deltaproteobacteria bacterium]|nr:hypothetical protein [Deltaproteobacteria bacterium]
MAIGAVAAGLMGCPSDPATDAAVDSGTMDTGMADTMPPPPPPDGGGDVVQQDTTRDTTTPPADTPPGDVPGDTPGMPGMSTRPVVNCGMVCSRPLDSIPDTMGRNIFFTAYNAMNEPAVFRAAVPAMGMPMAAPTQVVAGMGLAFPVGITLSNDDSTIYVADQAADRNMGAEVLEGVGAIFAIPAAGGAPTQVNVGTELLTPAAITITSDGMDLLITGQRRTDMGFERALFRVSRSGGTAMLMTTNLVDPSGVSQAPMGGIICHDTRRGGERSATAVSVTGMAATDVAGSLEAGYPAGLAYGLDSRTILLSGADPANGGGLLTFVMGDGRPMAPMALSTGMVAPLGLHRARSVNAWAVADEGAGDNGQIFMVAMGP